MTEIRPNSFKIVQLNAENLFLYLDDPTPRDWRKMSEKDWQKLSHATVPNKPLLKTLWLAESLLQLDPDVVVISEVGGEDSLNNFARLFLHGKYQSHLIEGNSDRGIDVGYLVRAGLPLRTELRTHKNRPLQFLYPHEQPTAGETARLRTHYFSRDCAELRLYPPGPTPSSPVLVILGVHLKSKLDPEGIDPQGRQRRRAELNTLVQIYHEVRTEFSAKVPILVAGDFNGCARLKELPEEFQQLATTDLESVVELAGKFGDDAATQIQVNRGGQVNALQIDFIFISPELRPHLRLESVGVYRYQSDLRVALPLPKTMEQRQQLPSDHYPVVATFERFF